MPKDLELTGIRFGKWTVIGKAQSRKDKAYWICQCDCGTMREVQSTSLVNGKSESCGRCGHVKSESTEIIKICDICGKKFKTIPYGKQRRFCYKCSPMNSRGAKSITAIRKAIKKQLVKYKGGKCEICGYDKCYRALQFHHKNPKEKDFSVSAGLKLGDFDMNNYYKEVDKCILVCANCHSEIHDSD